MQKAKKLAKSGAIVSIVGNLIVLLFLSITVISSIAVTSSMMSDLSEYQEAELLGGVTMIVTLLFSGLQMVLSLISFILSIVALVKLKNDETASKAKGLLIASAVINLIGMFTCTSASTGSVLGLIGIILGMPFLIASGIVMIIGGIKVKNAYALDQKLAQETVIGTEEPIIVGEGSDITIVEE